MGDSNYFPETCSKLSKRFLPIKIVDIDLSKGVQRIWGVQGYKGIGGLVRYRSQPIGWICIAGLNRVAVSTECVAEAIKRQIGWKFLPALLRGSSTSMLTDDPALPPISVVVCVSSRTSHLDACITGLLRLEYPNFEILVVDYTQSSHTENSVARLPVRYVREEQPGMARARNRGVIESHYEIIAFIDGDARPDPAWLRTIASAFIAPDVMAVTGSVAAAELQTMAQVRFEYGGYGMAGEFRSRRLGRDMITDDELLWANRFAAGTNMAFRRQVFSSVGSFDEAFDRDIPSDGSAFEMLHRLLADNHVMMYQPAALVWLTSPRDSHSLHRLVYEQSRAFGTYLVSCALNRTVSRLSLVRFLLREWLGRRLIYRMIRPGKATRRLVVAELRGALASLPSLKTLKPGIRPPAASENRARPPSTAPNVINDRAQNTRTDHRESKGEIAIRVIRTWYPHWGQYSGINQFLRHVDPRKYHVEAELVHENDSDFPIQSGTMRSWIRYVGRRQDMAWYNLSDFTAEIRALRYYWPKKAHIIHYLDGEHSAQFLPRLNKLSPKIRPQLVVSFHQPPEVLAEVIRKDNIPRYDCIIVVAPEQEEFFLALTKPEKVRLILHGIDTDYFKPDMRTADHETLTCITVGHNYRDYETVRAVAHKLKDDKRIVFHAVSPRPTGLDDLPNVRVYKTIDDDALLKLYQQANVLFLPLTKATANNSLLEGMACGLPVLTTLLPSIKTYAPGNETILVEKNCRDQFVDAILHLVENPQIRLRMAVEARRRAEELDWRNITPQYEATYSQLTGKS